MTASILHAPALMLNRNWVPIRVVTVRRALHKVIHGLARIVDDEYQTYDIDAWAQLRAKAGEPCVTTSYLSLPVPSVIVLSKYGEIPDRKLAFSRANVYKRDHYTCQYCGSRPGAGELTIEHITPRSRGGQSTWTNCVLACIKCNRRKADRTPQEAGMKLLKLPVKPGWSPRLVLAKVTNVPTSWEKFISEAYWNIELKE